MFFFFANVFVCASKYSCTLTAGGCTCMCAALQKEYGVKMQRLLSSDRISTVLSVVEGRGDQDARSSGFSASEAKKCELLSGLFGGRGGVLH